MSQHSADADSGSTTERVREQVTERAQVAQDKARGATGQARGRLRDQVDQRSTQAGERLSGTAADVRGVAEELRRQGKDTPARLVEQAAGQADRVAEYLKGASGERILRDVEDLARGNPWAVAAGGLALGFAASRFLKASSSRRYHAAQVDYPAAEPTATVPVVGTYDPAAPTVTTEVPAATEPIDADQRLPRAE